MKEKHVETRLQEDQLDPHKRIGSLEKEPSFMNFWQVCMEKSAKVKDLKEIAPLFSEYTERTWNVRKVFNEFHAFLKDVPLVIALRHWVEGVISDPSIGEKGVAEIKKLLECDLIPLKTSKGLPITLYDVRMSGHQDIIENIRSIRAWTQAEKDLLVNRYIRFSCDLARYTFDYVLSGCDLDRRHAESRLIPYEIFYSFIQYLSKRDALLAKVLYFGAPSMEEVLSLKTKAIDEKRCSIKFNEKSEKFPKHLIQELLLHVQENPNAKGLVFANAKGETVERAHLNQSFARASERMPEGVKITPGSLLRFHNTSI
jgi:hypothetical protein